MFIDRFHRIDPTKTYNFFAPTLVTSASHKITAKCCILCPKTLLLPEKQLHAIYFFVATRNVCPLAIPESCAQNMGMRLLENHSLTAGHTDVIYVNGIELHERLKPPTPIKSETNNSLLSDKQVCRKTHATQVNLKMWG